MLPFNLPPPKGFIEIPKWDGANFHIGDNLVNVLEYSENFSGWSDDLTSFHEDVAGDAHPIDLASRADALAQVDKCCTNSQSVILEVGCSSGFMLKDLARKYTDCIVIGSDVVKEPLYNLANELSGVPILRFDLLKNPLPNDCIDIVIMLNVLEHIENDLEALKNVYKFLKPGGRLIVEVPAGPWLYDSYDKELQHFRRYSAIELRDKLIKCGFIVQRKSHLGFLLYPAFFISKSINKLMGPQKLANVSERIQQTKKSFAFKILMNFESKYLANFNLPFGIRILATAKKPEN